MATIRKDLPYHYYSLDEYFALEGASDARFEYWDGDIVCMSGGSPARGTISGNVFYRLRQCLEGKSCRAFTADTAILTPALPPYRYPDASVGCGDLQFQRVRILDALVNPVLIVEVLSPSTADWDQAEKFAAYQQIESSREYLLIAQDAPRVARFTRRAGGEWERRDVSGLDGSVDLESVGCSLLMRDLYEGVEFAA